MRGINKEFLKRNVALRMRSEVALAASFAQVQSTRGLAVSLAVFLRERTLYESPLVVLV